MQKLLKNSFRIYIFGIFLLLGLTTAIMGQSAYPLTVSATTSWDIASDNNNNVYILWRNLSTLYFAKIVNHAVTGQQTVATDACRTKYGIPRLSVRPDGQTMSVVYANSDQTYLKHAWRDAGGTWRTESIIGPNANKYWVPCGAVGGDGTAHAVYAFLGKTYYTYKKVGANWVTPISINDLSGAFATRMIVDRDGGIHCTYAPYQSYINYRYAAPGSTLNASATEKVYGSGIVGSNDIFVTHNGTVHITLAYGSPPSAYHTFKILGGSFSTPTCASISPIITDFPNDWFAALGVDGNGRVFVSWAEEVNSIDIVKLSVRENNQWTINTIDPLANTVAGSGPICMSAITVTDMAGYLLWRHNDNKLWLGEYVFNSLMVTAPNGGESMSPNSSQDISWIPGEVTGNVKIELLKGETVLGTIAGNLDIDSSPYSWTAGSYQEPIGTWKTAPNAGDYRIKISTIDNNYSDTSDAYFALANPSFSLTAPNGGESWLTGSSQAITWTSTGTITNVRIEYSSNGGADWTDVIASTPDDGNHLWTIPNTPSSQCLVKVSDVANALVGATSSAVFSIIPHPALGVTSPDVTSFWGRRLTYSITWTKQGNVNDNVKILLFKGTSTLVKIITMSTANDGSYDWTVPTTLRTGSTYFVRIKTVDDLVYDDSDKFSIVVASITVTAPTSGTIWVYNATKSITWNKFGEQDANVKIELFKGRTKVLDITPETENDGTFDWTIPGTLASSVHYNIKITTLDGKVKGTSRKFTITSGYIRVNSPAFGTKWIRGTSQPITWEYEGAVNANVNIALYRRFAKILDISPSVPTADGSFTWDIPFDLGLGSIYSIKVTAIDNLITGKSGRFSIVAGIITVTAPTTGTSWGRNALHTITWNREGPFLNANVKIDLFRGSLRIKTLASTTENDGSFDWTIPSRQLLAANYRIRIVTVDNLVVGWSPRFTITTAPSLGLLSPNGNESLQALSRQMIRWTNDPEVIEVKLEFSRDNGGSFTTIADHVANTGNYDWTVPVNFTRNSIVRVSDSNGKQWQEDGLLEFSFKFNFSGEGEDPGAIFWFGGSDQKAPGYGFAKIEIGRDRIWFGGFTRTIEPLSGTWHELRVRFNFRRDTAELRLDDQMLFENTALNTTQEHYFQPFLVLQSGGDAPIDFTMDDLAVNIVQLDSVGEDQQLFNALSENFDRYDEKANDMLNCWRLQNPKVKESTMAVEAENQSNKILRLQSVAGRQVLIYLPLDIPTRIPFDISDQCFVIENQ